MRFVRWLPALVAIFSLMGLPAVNAGGHGKVRQHEQGRVTVSAYPDGSSCVDVNWRAGQIIGGPTNAQTSYRFEVNAGTYGRNFILRPAQNSQADFDVVFVDESDIASPSVIEEKATRSSDGEWGKVPRGTDVAYVCLYSNGPASFVYEAGAGLKLPPRR